MKPDFEKSDNQKHKFHKISGIIFAAFIFVTGAIGLIHEDSRFSESENRVLAKLPRLDADNILSGRFSRKFEKYSADQMPYRTLWVEMKSRTDLLLGRREVNGVLRGNEGFLFEKPSAPDKASMDEKISAINSFTEKYRNIQSFFILVPNASDILSSYLPEDAPLISQKEYIQDLYSELDSSVIKIDSYNALAQISEKDTFYRTDHHWTSDSAYAVFKSLARELKIDVTDSAYKKLPVTADFYGTLASKTGYYGYDGDTINVYLPDSKSDQYVVSYVEEKLKSPSLFDVSKLSAKNKYEVFMRGNHPLVKIKTAARNQKSLLVIKDSYANCFIPFLTAHFSRITVVDPRYYYEDLYELIDSEDISHVLYLYNANTFFEDRFLASVLNNE